jgi:hypothetical protein
MSQVAVDSSECTDCGAALHGASSAHCGQKATPIDPSVRHAVDRKILRSLRLLLTRPGFLTLELLRGRRASAQVGIRAAVVFFPYLFMVVIVFLFTAVAAAYLSRTVRSAA